MGRVRDNYRHRRVSAWQARRVDGVDDHIVPETDAPFGEGRLKDGKVVHVAPNNGIQ